MKAKIRKLSEKRVRLRGKRVKACGLAVSIQTENFHPFQPGTPNL